MVARKDTPRRNTVEQWNDTYTVYIFADRVCVVNNFALIFQITFRLQHNSANGTVYIDDLSSFNYQNSEYNYIGISYNNGTLSLRLLQSFAVSPITKLIVHFFRSNLAPGASYPDNQFVADSYIVYRPPSNLKSFGKYPHTGIGISDPAHLTML